MAHCENFVRIFGDRLGGFCANFLAVISENFFWGIFVEGYFKNFFWWGFCGILWGFCESFVEFFSEDFGRILGDFYRIL